MGLVSFSAVDTQRIAAIRQATAFRVYAESTLKKGREYDHEYLNIELRGPASPAKAEVADQIKNMRQSFRGISAAWAHLNYGQDELELSLESRAAELGLSPLFPGRQSLPDVTAT